MADAELQNDVVANLKKLQEQFHGPGEIAVADVAVTIEPDDSGIWSEHWVVEQNGGFYQYPLIFEQKGPNQPQDGVAYMVVTEKEGPNRRDSADADTEVDGQTRRTLDLLRIMENPRRYRQQLK